MSEFLNLQAALGQTAFLAGLSGGNVSVSEGQGGFSAVLGAVMAESGFGISQAAVNGVEADADIVPVEAVGDIPSEALSEEDISAVGAAKALTELYKGITGALDEDIPEELFTSAGARAFLSAAQRYISMGSVPPKEAELLWKDVSDDEKSAYADILAAIASECVVLHGTDGGEAVLDSEDVLEFVYVETGKLAAAAVKAVPEKDRREEKDISPYIMSVFIAPSFSVNMDDTADRAENMPDMPFVNGLSAEDTPAEAYGGLNVNAFDSEAAAAADLSDLGKASEGAFEEVSDNVDLAAFGEIVSEVFSEEDPEMLRKFCGDIARELNAQVAFHAENAGKEAAPEDIGRAAFMARISSAEEMPEFGVDKALRQNFAGVEAFARAADDTEAADSEAVNTVFNETKVKTVGEETNDTDNERSVDDSAVIREVPFENAVRSALPAENAEEVAETADTPVSPADIEEIARRISENVSRGREESITLRLAPEELGEIKITVSRKAGETVVAFEARKSESAMLISDRAAALADSLSARGIAVREISVTDMSSGRDDRGNGSDQTGGSYRENHGAGSDGSENASRNGYSRHFYFEEPEDTESSDENYYYDKEANLWLSI